MKKKHACYNVQMRLIYLVMYDDTQTGYNNYEFAGERERSTECSKNFRFLLQGLLVEVGGVYMASLHGLLRYNDDFFSKFVPIELYQPCDNKKLGQLLVSK